MKVNIGPYKNWFGPYQLADALCFWVPKKQDEYGYESKPEWVHKFGDFLAYGFIKRPDAFMRNNADETWLYKFLSWIDSKKNRKVKIHIDNYDVWNMNSTLAMIILPMLKILQEKKQGAGFVDDKDVPKELRSTSAPPKENDWDADENHFKRWDWVLSEMIWAFEQLNDENNDDQFFTGESDYYMGPADEKGFRQMLEGPNHTRKYDAKAHQKHQKRITNGLMLFGKYYQNLWD
jgi:hypothetical protein